MRTIITIMAFILIASMAAAQITMEVYESDGTTIFDNRNIWTGTQLKLIVSSDSSEFWYGGLFIAGSNRNLAYLSGSGNDPNSRDYEDCHLLAAGSNAMVTRWEDSTIEGFDLFSSYDDDPTSGDWFVIDYIASSPGDPNVGFYDYDISWVIANSSVTFHQVPKADFNADGVVDYIDFAMLAKHWEESTCPDPAECQIVDLNSDDVVDANDLILFADDWLWGIPEPEPEDPNGPPMPPSDPNLVFSIVDPNGLDEITINVNDTVTLYINMTNNSQVGVWAFNVDATISDPNLGSIDNTPYDPNNPPGAGTARLLAGPYRWTMFDSWGPGAVQQEGINFTAVNALLVGGFDDGHLASFEFTCQGLGDVTLELVNLETSGTNGNNLHPTVESILIHQVDPNSLLEGMSMMSSQELLTTEPQPTTVSTEEILMWLNYLWKTDDDIQNMIDKKDWKLFIKSVEESY
ncbi:MAG: hypothetical protein KAS23_00025 [Anaerohalosphaera sp.]|nr:hypothetical protein [Anaerohalosphaera sp.]